MTPPPLHPSCSDAITNDVSLEWGKSRLRLRIEDLSDSQTNGIKNILFVRLSQVRVAGRMTCAGGARRMGYSIRVSVVPRGACYFRRVLTSTNTTTTYHNPTSQQPTANHDHDHESELQHGVVTTTTTPPLSTAPM